jgi:cyclopropane-fatty-acyl-phospholipid synthase
VEDITNIVVQSDTSWFEKRCRSVVFKTLDKLAYGSLEIIEHDQRFHFGSKDNHANESSETNAVKGTLVVRDHSLYKDLVLKGSIGFAEAYIDGKWTSPNLTSVIRIFAKAQQVIDQLESNKGWVSRIKNALIHRANRNTHKGSKNNISAHYDLGNELYTRFLDPKMMYSAAIYPDEDASLEDAQLNKLNVICERLALKESDHLIEIGTGWGGLAIHAAQHYGCRVTTTTISEEQHEYAKQKITELGLQGKITLLKKDYRDLQGHYDKLVSIEMIEAVGYEFLPSFFNQCNALLKPGGKMLLQSITIADQRFDYYRKNVDFIQRYIFPGGFLPSVTEISHRTTRHTDMVIESIDDIGLDYAKTLAHWREKFLESWHELTDFGYDEHFKRLWLYYFGYCEGAFLERSTSTVHVVLRKN